MLRILSFILLVAIASAEPRQAVVTLRNDAKGIDGIIKFEETSDGVKIVGTIKGLTAGLHGFHVHQKGDISALDCTSAGGHFNPYNKSHGSPQDEDRHVGDLGNVKATGGETTLNFTDKIISLSGDCNIVGRALVIHADADDLGKGGFTDSKTTGHAGSRLACGVIGIVADDSAASGQHMAIWLVISSLILVILRPGID